jgi:hypothetical protein
MQEACALAQRLGKAAEHLGRSVQRFRG